MRSCQREWGETVSWICHWSENRTTKLRLSHISMTTTAIRVSSLSLISLKTTTLTKPIMSNTTTPTKSTGRSAQASATTPARQPQQPQLWHSLCKRALLLVNEDLKYSGIVQDFSTPFVRGKKTNGEKHLCINYRDDSPAWAFTFSSPRSRVSAPICGGIRAITSVLTNGLIEYKYNLHTTHLPSWIGSCIILLGCTY